MAEENHVEKMHKKVSEAWVHLNSIWAQFGYDEEKFAKRRRDVVMHVSELLKDMCQEAEDRLSDQQTKLDELMKEILQLAKDLTIDQVPELNACTGKPLLEMEKALIEIANELRKRKAIRMEKYEKINEQVVHVAGEIEENPMRIEFEGIPADSQVAQLEQHLGQLRHLKKERLQLYKEYRMEILELFELLEKLPRNELEQLLMEDEISLNRPISVTGIKALSKTVLEKLDSIHLTLKKQLAENKDEGDRIWPKIQDLWSRLNVDEELIAAFTKVHQPISTQRWQNVYKPSTLCGLNAELGRLEEAKRENMELFIKQVREELCQLWLSKCFMATVEERFMEPNYNGLTAFSITDFNDDLYTEELLQKHEEEVKYWRDFADRNKKIIDLVNKRGNMFAQYKTLDQKSDDPSRLANRGGALLKEEKERKQLEKTIPKVEAQLKEYCDMFEDTLDDGHGMRKFLVYGRTINEMIEQDWEQFHEEKRIRKEAKKNPKEAAGANRTMTSTQLGNPNNRKRAATPSSTNRTPKRNRTQNTITLTPGKTLQSPFIHPASSTKKPFGSKENFLHPTTSTAKSAKKTPNKIMGSGMLTRQASSGKIPLPTKLTGKEQVPPSGPKIYSKDSVISPVTSYSEFTDHLLCQSTLNSSAVVPIGKQAGASATAGSTTPTKSVPGLSFTPAKVPLGDNRF